MEIKEAIQAVHNAPANTDLRVTRRLEIGSAIHQGDVYVIRVADDHARGPQLGTRQVAVGTHSGARHVAEGDGVQVFTGAKLPDGVSVPSWATVADMLGPVVVAEGPWRLTHPEHAHHSMPAGTFQVTYQMDYTTRQRVQD